jgi:hypothetical protein
LERYALKGVTEWYVDAAPVTIDGLRVDTGPGEINRAGAAAAYPGAARPTPATATTAAARRLRRRVRASITTFRR